MIGRSAGRSRQDRAPERRLVANTASLAVEITSNIGRAGVNYRFGAPEPIIAECKKFDAGE